MQFFAVVGSAVLPVNNLLHWLGVVYPLETAESVCDWHNVERLQVEVPRLALRIFLENTVHDLKQLLYTLVESQVFTAFNKQIVIFFV